MASEYKRLNRIIRTSDYDAVVKYLNVKGHRKSRHLRRLSRLLDYWWPELKEEKENV